MRDHGYYTLGVVANYIHTYPHTGLDRGFVRYDAGIATEWELFQVSSAGSLLKWSLNKLGVYSDLPTRKDANVITERFFNLVERREQRPFFAFMNYFDAHYDFDSPAPCEAIHPEWGLAETPVPPNVDDNKLHAPHDDVAQQPFDQERKQVLTDYDCMIAYLDDRLGALVEGLEQRGLLDQTIVIVTSDHGEEFWEHGRFGHGWNLYNTTLFVPLVIYVPKGTRAGARVPHPVDLQDLPRTVVELAGIGESTHFDGRNLLAIAEDGSATTGPILSEVALPDEPERWGRRSLVWANLHYIQNPDGSEEIYDIDEDSWEVRNLLGTPGGNAALARFRPALSSLIKDDELLSTAVEAGTSEDRAVKPRRIEARR
jgi:arylsulfatase A-like enzyme